MCSSMCDIGRKCRVAKDCAYGWCDDKSICNREGFGFQLELKCEESRFFPASPSKPPTSMIAFMTAVESMLQESLYDVAKVPKVVVRQSRSYNYSSIPNRFLVSIGIPCGHKLTELCEDCGRRCVQVMSYELQVRKMSNLH